MASWLRKRIVGHRPIILEPLEERIVLDAAGGADVENTAEDAENSQQEQTQDSENTSDATTGAESGVGSVRSDDPLAEVYGQDLSVVLISNALDEIEVMNNATTQGTEVVVFDAATGTIDSLNDLLHELVESNDRKIGQLAVLSHGDVGELKLGPLAVFTIENLHENPEPWLNLGDMLSDEARIDLYGCNIGAGDDGASFINSLATLTGATVWASDDDTASANLGGDWDLESHTADDYRGYLLDSAALGDDIGPLFSYSYTIVIVSEQTVEKQGEPQLPEGVFWDLVTYDESAITSDVDALKTIVDCVETSIAENSFFYTPGGIELLTDGEQGELILADEYDQYFSITMEDLEDPEIQAQLTRLTELIYTNGYEGSLPAVLNLWGSEIAKGDEGEAFVDRLAELTYNDGYYGRFHLLAVRAGDDLSGGEVNRTLHYTEAVPEWGMDWELEYIDSASQDRETWNMHHNRARVEGMSLDDGQDYFYENYFVVGRAEFVGAGYYTIVAHDYATGGLRSLYFVHNSLVGAQLIELQVGVEADLDGESYFLDLEPLISAKPKAPNLLIVPANNEYVVVVPEGSGQGYKYQGVFDSDGCSGDEDTFSKTFDLGDKIYSATDDGVYRVDFHFGEGDPDWYAWLWANDYLSGLPWPGILPGTDGVDYNDWGLWFLKMDSYLQKIYSQATGDGGYIMQLIMEGLSATFKGYYAGWDEDWDDITKWWAGDGPDENYMKATLEWNPAPEKIRDLEAEVVEHTTGVSLQISNYFLVDSQGIVGYTVKSYSEGLFSNFSTSADGLIFDTAEVSEPQTGYIVFTAEDAWGAEKDFMILVDLVQKAEAVSFEAAGMQYIPIDLDDWQVTDDEGTTFDPVEVVIVDYPDYGTLYFENEFGEMQPLENRSGVGFSWADTDSLYYESPGETSNTFTGLDSLEYMIGFNDEGGICYSGSAVVEIDVNSNPGVHQVGLEDVSVAIEQFGAGGEAGQVSFENLSDLTGKGQLVYVDGAGVETVITADSTILYEVGGDLPTGSLRSYRFDPNPDWYGSVTFVYEFTGEGGSPSTELRYGEIEIQPANDTPTVDGYDGVIVSPGTIDEGEGTFVDTSSLYLDDAIDLQYLPQWSVDDTLYTLEIAVRARYYFEHPFTPIFGNGLTLTFNEDYRAVASGSGYKYEDVWTVTGTLEELNLALDSGLELVPSDLYSAAEHFNGEAQVLITLNDKGNVGSDTVLIGGDYPAVWGDDAAIEFTVNEINDEPTIQGPTSADDFNEGTSIQIVGENGFLIHDGFDNRYSYVGGETYRLEFIVTSLQNGDVHPFDINLFNGKATQFDAETNTWWVEDTFNNLSEALDEGIYITPSTSCEDYFGPSIIVMTLHDLGSQGGDDKTATLDIHINTMGVNDEPEILGEAAFSALEEGAVVTMTGLELLDWKDQQWMYGDSGKSLEGEFTFSVTADDLPGSYPYTIAFGNGFDGLIDNGDGTWSVTATFAEIEQAMDSDLLLEPVDPTTNEPYSDHFHGWVTMTITVDDLGNLGEGDSDPAQREIHFYVAPVNDTPEVTVPSEVQAGPEETDITISGIAVDDQDDYYDPGRVRQVSLSVSNGALFLSSTNNLVFTAGANGHATMTFQGILADLNVALDDLTYRGNQDFFGSDVLTVTIDDLGETGLKGAEETDSKKVVISVIGVPEFDEFGKSNSDNSFQGTQGKSIDVDMFRVPGVTAAVNNLLDFLASQSLLPKSSDGGVDPGTGYSWVNPTVELTQLGLLMQDALFEETSESRHQAWDSLLSFVSAKKTEGGGEWLGLEDFFLKLKEWQIDKTLDEILLVFNTDEIKLVDWFSSFVSSADDLLGIRQASAAEFGEDSQQSLSVRSMVFNMNEMSVADLFSSHLGDHHLTDSNGPCNEAGSSASRVFHLGAMSFVKTLGG